MVTRNKLLILSEKLELYHLLIHHFGAEYEVETYRKNEWDIKKEKLLPTVLDRVMLVIIETEDRFSENIRIVRQIQLYSFSGYILFISRAEDRIRQIEEKIYAIDSGADEYLAYPQTNEEILASVRALLRRVHWKGNFTLDISGKRFQINAQARKIFMDGIELVFTKTEFAIMNYLILHLNRAVSYKELYEAVWGKEYIYDDRNIMAHIHRMRKKMGDDTKNPRYVQNVYGTGYMVEGE